MIEDLKLIRPGEVRVRIAPAPTGPLHLGTARTSLFNYLFARKYQGSFILRVEDTDLERSSKEWEKEMRKGLKWLGIDWQEGPDIGGKYGPYRQSERKEIYKKYLDKLLADKKIYYCFCSQEELEDYRNYLMSIGQPPRYSGKCRELSETEVEKNLKRGKPYVLRFKTPSKKVSFKDLLRGKIEQETESFGDIVVAKNLFTPLYNLACVIDDFEMKISHIIRGEDHIPNTPKQILIAEALGIETPKYLHLPLILGQDRAKLSKRHGPVAIADYKKAGYLPEAVVNFIALLGWNPGTEREIFSIPSLIKEFSFEGIQKSGAVFNPQKLDWLNGFYIRSKSPKTLTELCLPYLIRAGLIIPVFKTEQYPPAYGGGLITQNFRIKETAEEISFVCLQNIVKLYQERLKKLSEIPILIDFFFKKQLDYKKELLRWKNIEDKEIKKSLDRTKKLLQKIKPDNWTKEKLQEVLLKLAQELGAGDRGKVLWPLRVALTGKETSASPFEIAEVLGKEKTLKRIKEARKKL
ncbi:MAG: glutamate--tRNA ligase [Patescibacteria group bacterium]|nr:glutamate--tRNA ligase [Patescibacteria group bacterium]